MKISHDIYRRIAAAKIFIDDNYREAIGLNHIAQQAFISPHHFHRLFRKIYKRTPHQYLTQKRLDKAKELLSENKTVMDTCNEVGFESIGSFGVLFKKEIGSAPTYYRNMAWLRKQEQKHQPLKFIPHCFIQSWQLK